MSQLIYNFLSRILCLGIFIFSVNVYGSVKNLDEKFQMEKAIADKLEQALKTRLDKNYFDITVDAKINTSVDSSQSANSKTIYKPTGEKDVLQTWLLKELSQNKKSIEFESIQVTLGLSDRIRSEYREDLTHWLDQWVLAVLGSAGSSEVVIRPTNILNKESQTEEAIPHFFSILGSFQNLIGMLFLGTIFLIAFSKSRSTETNNPVQSNEIITINPVPEMQKLTQMGSESKDQDALKTLKIRVGVVGKTMSTQVEYLINRWATKEHEHLLKIVTLLEALAENGSALENLQIQALPILSKDASASLSKAFGELNCLPHGEKIELLEEIYTELVAGNLIRLSSNQPAFEFLEIFEPEQLMEIFSKLRGSYQVCLLAKMSDAAKRKFMNFVNPELIKNLFEASLETHQISDEDLLEALKKSGANTRKEKQWKSDFTEQSINKTRQIWAGLSRKDETLWLYQFITKNPEMKKYFYKEKNHLAFLSDWSPQELRKFSLKTQTNDLAAAIKLLPQLAHPILNVCGIKMREEISQCVAQLEEPRLSEYFESFIATYDAYILSEMSEEKIIQELLPKKAA